jgi:hypothetical protein
MSFETLTQSFDLSVGSFLVCHCFPLYVTGWNDCQIIPKAVTNCAFSKVGKRNSLTPPGIIYSLFFINHLYLPGLFSLNRVCKNVFRFFTLKYCLILIPAENFHDEGGIYG